MKDKDALETATKIRRSILDAEQAFRAIEAASRMPGAELCGIPTNLTLAKQGIHGIKDGLPYSACTRCQGRVGGCIACDQLGWITAKGLESQNFSKRRTG